MPINPFSGELLAESPYAVAETMLGRVLTDLEASPTSDPITESYVALGEVAFDECCGTLVTLPLRTFSPLVFPNPAGVSTNCDVHMLAVDIAVMLLRCVPVIDEIGNPPTAEQMSAAYAKAGEDAAVVMNSILGPLPEGWQRANIEQTFRGADGGCIVTETRVTIGLPQSEWCDA